MHWFTADEHYGHRNIIGFCARPFDTVHEMNDAIITKHNDLVKAGDVVIHCGDFAWRCTARHAHESYISRLAGTHIFLRGSHDKWMDRTFHEIWEKTIDGQHVVACHYAMRTWPKSHYGSWQVYGHSHGNLPPMDNQWDVGVDNNDFCPMSMDQLREKVESKS